MTRLEFSGARTSLSTIRHHTLSALCCLLSLILVNAGCADESEGLDASTTLNQQRTSGEIGAGDGLKGDDERSPFPSERDIAILIPQYRAIYPALEIIPNEWLEDVDDALLESDIGQRISEESKPDDWSLVAIRISPCSPLGSIADAEEIDQLCWPEVRLVLQPIAQLIEPRGRPVLFPEDRAIHALYRVEPKNPALTRLLELTRLGLRLDEIDPKELDEIASERDLAVARLLTSTRQLRMTKDIYHRVEERPEFFDAKAEEAFWDALTQHLITPYCEPRALHHLTAMSLPLGRAPVPLDLWSFVAFNAQDGLLERADLEVKDKESGEVFFNFSADLDKGSEDVSAARADPKLLQRFAQLEESVQERLIDQTILDQTQVPSQAPKIIDPYQTLVVHTTCSSCHRFNDTPFNFHNLSYFGDRAMTVSPRVEADVRRDLDWLKRLLSRSPDLF